jgi:hypothetical protein
MPNINPTNANNAAAVAPQERTNIVFPRLAVIFKSLTVSLITFAYAENITCAITVAIPTHVNDRHAVQVAQTEPRREHSVVNPTRKVVNTTEIPLRYNANIHRVAVLTLSSWSSIEVGMVMFSPATSSLEKIWVGSKA